MRGPYPHATNARNGSGSNRSRKVEGPNPHLHPGSRRLSRRQDRQGSRALEQGIVGTAIAIYTGNLVVLDLEVARVRRGASRQRLAGALGDGLASIPFEAACRRWEQLRTWRR